jgi:hypothetical protein
MHLSIRGDFALDATMKEHIYGYAAILATLLSLPSLAAKLRNDDPASDDKISDASPPNANETSTVQGMFSVYKPRV